MRALILASGCGGQPGDQLPECLISLAGRRLIDRQITALRGGGATEIGVVRGYRGELIDLPDVTYFADDRWASCSAVMSLATAATWLRSGPVIVSAANIFYQAELVHRLGSVRGSLVIAYDRQWREVWTRRFGETAADIATFRRGASGNLLEIGNKTTKVDEVEGRYVGLLKFTPTA